MKELCYDAQKLRSSATTIAKGQELRAKIEEKEKNGYTSQTEREELRRQLEDYQVKEKQAGKQLKNVQQKIENTNSPLKNVINKLKPQAELSIAERKPEEIKLDSKTKYRTDKPIYSRFSKQEKKLIGRIYTAIGNAIADEKLREALISNIEEQITK